MSGGVFASMDLFGDDDISWLTQSDSGNANFDITTNFMDNHVDQGIISLEENLDRVDIYEGVYAENISDDEALDTL